MNSTKKYFRFSFNSIKKDKNFFDSHLYISKANFKWQSINSKSFVRHYSIKEIVEKLDEIDKWKEKLDEIENGSCKWKNFNSMISELSQKDKDEFLDRLWTPTNFPILFKLLQSFDTLKEDFKEPNLLTNKFEKAEKYVDIGTIKSAKQIISKRKNNYRDKKERPQYGYLINAPGTGKSRSCYEIAKSLMKEGTIAVNTTFNDSMELIQNENKEYALQIRILASYFFPKEAFKKDKQKNYHRWTTFISDSITWDRVLEFVVWHWKERVYEGQLPEEALSHDGKPLAVLMIDELSIMSYMCKNDLVNDIAVEYVTTMKDYIHPSFLLCPFYSTLEPDAIKKAGGSTGAATTTKLRLLNESEIEEISNSAEIDFNNQFIKNLLLSTRGNPRSKFLKIQKN